MRLLLFGGVHLEDDTGRVIPIRTHRARALLAFLAMRPGAMIHREQVCAALWPDADDPAARCQLRKTLWRVRSALEDGQSPGALCVEDHQMGLFPQGLWSDAWAFAGAMAQVEFKHDSALDRDDAESLLSAVQLHAGHYAAGLPDSWCADEQARLAGTWLAAMERLIAYHRHVGQWIQAIVWAQRALVQDNLKEHLHRIIMACHLSMGDRASALRQYQVCADILQAELGIEPMAETRALQDAILAGADAEAVQAALASACTATRAGGAGPRVPALSEVEAAIAALSGVQRNLASVREELRTQPPA